VRKASIEIATFALFAALAVVMTWPLAANLGSAVPDHTDAYWSVFVMRWDAHALTSSARLFDLPIFHPHRNALAFSESLAGIAIPMLPLYLAGAEPLTVYNAALLFGFALSGYGAFVLCRTATGSRAAALAGGVFFAFLPYRFNHIAQIQYVSAGWLALTLAAWLHWTASPTRGRAALFGAAFFINGLACLHWLVLGGLAVAFAAPIAVAMHRPLRKPRAWLALAIASAIACVALAPLPVHRGAPHERHGARDRRHAPLLGATRGLARPTVPYAVCVAAEQRLDRSGAVVVSRSVRDGVGGCGDWGR
jgi:hypothetical protein